MPWRGSDEEALCYRKLLVIQRKDVVPSLASGGLMRFVEDTQVEGFSLLHRITDDGGRLIGAEDYLRSLERGIEESADVFGIRRDLEIEIRLRSADGIRIPFDRRIGTDAEVGEGIETRLPQPLVQCLPQKRERGEQDEDLP